MKNKLLKALKEKRFIPGTKGEPTWQQRGIEGIMAAPFLIMILALLSMMTIGCGTDTSLAQLNSEIERFTTEAENVLDDTISTNTIPGGAEEDVPDTEVSGPSFSFAGTYATSSSSRYVEVRLAGDTVELDVHWNGELIELDLVHNETEDFYNQWGNEGNWDQGILWDYPELRVQLYYSNQSKKVHVFINGPDGVFGATKDV